MKVEGMEMDRLTSWLARAMRPLVLIATTSMCRSREAACMNCNQGTDKSDGSHHLVMLLYRVDPSHVCCTFTIVLAGSHGSCLSCFEQQRVECRPLCGSSLSIPPPTVSLQ